MRKPDTIERLYLDFDGFFASVEQQARPSLRGKPIGIVPFDGTVHSRYGKSLVTMGPWKLPPGGNLGGKISFTRIPRAEDFW